MTVTRIAEHAGVSIATVSRVLNRSRRVNPETEAAVRRALKELNVPDEPPRAAGGRGRKNGTANGTRPPRARSKVTNVAVVAVGRRAAGWFEIPVIANVVGEIMRSAERMRVGVSILEMPDPARINPMLKKSQIQGALALVDSGRREDEIEPLAAHMPTVKVMGGQLGASRIDHVTVDNNAVGDIAARHLLGRGLRRLAFFSAVPSWEITMLRAQGFLATAAEAGHSASVYLANEGPPRPLDLFGPRAHVFETVQHAVAAMKAQADGEPLALFASRDAEVIPLYPALREAGLEPGRDVHVISCDNTMRQLPLLDPAPTSIDLSPTEVAQRAVQRLINRISNPAEQPMRILVSPTLMQTVASPDAESSPY